MSMIVNNVKNKFYELFVSNPASVGHDVIRYSGIYCKRSECIMQHTSQVMMFSYVLAKIFESNGTSINYKDLLEKGLLHDLDETITGDIPRTIKYFNKEVNKSIKEISNKLVSDTVELLIPELTQESVQDIVEVINNSKKGKEGFIISLVDLMCVALKSYEEIELLSNYKFLRVAYDLKTYLLEFSKELLVDDKAKVFSQFDRESKSLITQLITDTIYVIDDILTKNNSQITSLRLPDYSMTNKSKKYESN